MTEALLTKLFLKVVNMSVSAGWLVLAVLLLRVLLRKAPKWTAPALWAIVGLRLMMPFSIESVLSLIPSAETVSPEILYAPRPAIDSGVPIINQAVNPVLAQNFSPNPAAGANPLQTWLFVAACVWVIGAVGMVLYALGSYLVLKRRVETAVLFRDDLYQSDAVATPFVLGVIRPKIYLPFSLPEGGLDYVIAHERAHIARRDHWWKPLGFLLLAVHWFDPLLWAAYMLLCRDMELACDERVIQTLDPALRADYSQALLECSVPRRMISACPLAFGEVGVKERVKRVLNYKKPAFYLTCAAVVACAVAAVCFLTDPVSSVEPDPSPAHDGDIRDTVAWDTPAGLTETDYSVLYGEAGGVLFQPDAYRAAEEYTPPDWYAAGGVFEYYTRMVVTWKEDRIEHIFSFSNHSALEEVRPLDGLCAPAFLVKESHDLYTGADLGEMEEAGPDPDAVEPQSSYWCVYFARPGAEKGVVVTLNAKNFTETDILALARSVRY